MRELVINADDFGFTRDVNDGIVEGHRSGILGATTLMANGDAFDHAVALAAANPGLDVGCHLVLVRGRSVLNPGEELPPTVAALLHAIVMRRIPVYDELAAQIHKIVSAGIRPTHLDTHKHTHLFPPVLDAVVRLSREFGIPWVRRPFDFPRHGAGDVPLVKRMTSDGLGFLRRRFHTVLDKNGCRTTDYFAGFQLTGRFCTPELIELIRHLPDGATEFMCHPGLCTDELRAAHTRLKESRERELAALVAPETKAALAEAGVKLVTYRDLA